MLPNTEKRSYPRSDFKLTSPQNSGKSQMLLDDAADAKTSLADQVYSQKSSSPARWTPYKSDKPNKKYSITTNEIKTIFYFGSAGYSDFTIHQVEERKLKYIKQHNNENWAKSGINSAGFWSSWLLWHLPTITAGYQDIKKIWYITFQAKLLFIK